MTFVEYLSQRAPEDWVTAVETLTLEFHAIDTDAARIWFAFYPNGPRPEHIASSHNFLYGHRYWPQVKRAILAASKDSSWPVGLAELFQNIADHATRTTQVDRDQLLGVTAASVSTLRHQGLEAFTASANVVQLPNAAHVRSIRQTRRARGQQVWRPFGSLFGKPRFRMRFSEGQPDATFDVTDGETVGAGMPASLRRCGPVCSGACSFGVIAGTQFLLEMDADEAARLTHAHAYLPKSAAGDSLIRLACYARPKGDVTFVLPLP